MTTGATMGPKAPPGCALSILAGIVSGVFREALGQATLRNGVSIEIRLARPIDLERVRRFYQLLSDTSTYYRFFGIRRALPDAQLRGVVTQRLPDHITLLAVSGRSIIGIGEYVPGTTVDEVEVAFTVADDHHHEGVATLLLERLAVIAKRCGILRLTALTLPGNSDMQLVFRTVGLPESQRFDTNDGVIHVRLDLAGIDDMVEMARARAAASAGDPKTAQRGSPATSTT